MNNSLDNFLNIFELRLDTDAPLKRISNTALTFLSKIWMINAIKNLITIQDRLYKRILRTKNLQQKEIRFDKHKQSRNYISVLIRKSRVNYYQKNFLKT